MKLKFLMALVMGLLFVNIGKCADYCNSDEDCAWRTIPGYYYVGGIRIGPEMIGGEWVANDDNYYFWYRNWFENANDLKKGEIQDGCYKGKRASQKEVMVCFKTDKSGDTKMTFPSEPWSTIAFTSFIGDTKTYRHSKGTYSLRINGTSLLMRDNIPDGDYYSTFLINLSEKFPLPESDVIGNDDNYRFWYKNWFEGSNALKKGEIQDGCYKGQSDFKKPLTVCFKTDNSGSTNMSFQGEPWLPIKQSTFGDTTVTDKNCNVNYYLRINSESLFIRDNVIYGNDYSYAFFNLREKYPLPESEIAE